MGLHPFKVLNIVAFRAENVHFNVLRKILYWSVGVNLKVGCVISCRTENINFKILEIVSTIDFYLKILDEIVFRAENINLKFLDKISGTDLNFKVLDKITCRAVGIYRKVLDKVGIVAIIATPTCITASALRISKKRQLVPKIIARKRIAVNEKYRKQHITAYHIGLQH